MSQIADEFERSAFECAYEAYRADPSNANATKLSKQSHVLGRKGRSGLGPAVAVHHVMRERGQAGTRWQGRLAIWILERLMGEKRPGWNDYWMIRWQLTKSPVAVWEIHRRARHIIALPDDILTAANPIDAAAFLKDPWYPVAYSARWMVNSQRQTDPEFAAAIEAVENSCPSCHPPISWIVI